jgi:peptidoglycan/LPS O-acetylase OafA/YrhL
MYLWHLVVLLCWNENVSGGVYFGFYEFLGAWFSDLFMTFLLGLWSSVMVEWPIGNLWKTYMDEWWVRRNSLDLL